MPLVRLVADRLGTMAVTKTPTFSSYTYPANSLVLTSLILRNATEIFIIPVKLISRRRPPRRNMNDPALPHSPRIYHPLASDEFTRVFELEAGEFSSPIVGRLVPQAVDDEPYEAISYVWGDPSARRDIIVDGETLSVTANLHGALTAFRHRPSSESCDQNDTGTIRVRRLWADAICINQDDLTERISQVELMSNIFAGASRVLCWLGWEEGEEGRRHTQDAIRLIHVFMKNPEAGLNDARILLLHHDYQADPAEDLGHMSQDDQRKFGEQARKWEGVKKFFEIEYFHRTWIVQELGLARQAILHTARKPTEDEVKALDGHLDGAQMMDESVDSGLEVDSIDWELVGRFVEFMDYNGASLVTHLQLLLWVAHHTLMVWATKDDGSPDCDFLTGMHWTRILGVTDARDRVFGLLGHPLAKIDGELVVHPDYTPTRGVIYTKLATNFIEKTKNLYVVSLVDHEHDPSLEELEWDPDDDARMPSWAPDWHSINRTTPVDYPVDGAVLEDLEIRIEGSTDGEPGTPLPHLLAAGWLVDEISVVGNRMETTDFPVTHLAREIVKRNPFWLDRAWELVRPECSEDMLAVLESLSLALPLGTREKGEPVSKAGLNQTLEEHHRSFAAYVFEYHELIHGALSEARKDNQDHNTSDLPARSIIDTLPAEAQSELKRRAEGASSGGFLECMVWPSMCRVLYRTKSGLVGMGSRITKPGDLVCRVKGSSVLVTLRKAKNGDTAETEMTNAKTDTVPLIRCVHVGPTVVPARMRKGVIDGAEYGEKPVNFRIL
jgi:hypothetical protein